MIFDTDNPPTTLLLNPDPQHNFAILIQLARQLLDLLRKYCRRTPINEQMSIGEFTGTAIMQQIGPVVSNLRFWLMNNPVTDINDDRVTHQRSAFTIYRNRPALRTAFLLFSRVFDAIIAPKVDLSRQTFDELLEPSRRRAFPVLTDDELDEFQRVTDLLTAETLPLADDGHPGVGTNAFEESQRSDPAEGAESKTMASPTDDAIKCYRAYIFTGKKQQELADLLTVELGKTISQGTVSRWITQVKKWLSKDNVLPDLPKPIQKPSPIDPATLEMGNRRDHLTPRQRERRSDDDGD